MIGSPPGAGESAGPAESDREKRFDTILRTRILLSLALLPPLLFFFFLVLWFREGFILIPVGIGFYLYMLAEFFYFQNPAVRSRRHDEAKSALSSAEKPAEQGSADEGT